MDGPEVPQVPEGSGEQRKMDPKHTRDEKNAFSSDETGQNVQIFEESLFFKLRTTIKQKTVKPNYLLSV